MSGRRWARDPRSTAPEPCSRDTPFRPVPRRSRSRFRRSAPPRRFRRGGSAGRLSAPTDADFARAAAIDLVVPSRAFGAESAILSLDWRGDVVRAFIGDELIADQFWYGRSLEIDLEPHREALADVPLTLRAFAWAPDTEVYVDARIRPEEDGPVLEIRSAVVTAASTQTFV